MEVEWIDKFLPISMTIFMAGCYIPIILIRYWLVKKDFLSSQLWGTKVFVLGCKEFAN